MRSRPLLIKIEKGDEVSVTQDKQSRDLTNDGRGKLHNRVAIITGGSGGIGEATARSFLAEGAQVLLLDLHLKNLEDVAKKLDSSRVKVMAVDVASAEGHQEAIEFVERQFGRLDIYFANAGVEGRTAPLIEQKEEDFEHVLDVNLKGVWLGIKAASPLLKKSGGGSILITSSVAGLRGVQGLGPYVISKHALQGLVKVAAAELGADNIRVNSINPGPVDNRMMRSIEQSFSPESPEAVKDGFTARIPLGRYASNEDIAKLACFLASEDASYLTGSSFVADGGFTTS